jgi:hypothetical protein
MALAFSAYTWRSSATVFVACVIHACERYMRLLMATSHTTAKGKLMIRDFSFRLFNFDDEITVQLLAGSKCILTLVEKGATV